MQTCNQFVLRCLRLLLPTVARFNNFKDILALLSLSGSVDAVRASLMLPLNQSKFQKEVILFLLLIAVALLQVLWGLGSIAVLGLLTRNIVGLALKGLNLIREAPGNVLIVVEQKEFLLTDLLLDAADLLLD